MKNLIKLTDKQSKVVIENGELLSYSMNEKEFIHQKGSPGWRNSDTEMFPVIGPTAQNNFVVPSPKGESLQDQHGLLREFPYTLISFDETSAVFEKIYKANTPVTNSKFPKKSKLEMVSWPYDFRFQKSFTLYENRLIVEFYIASEIDMPFMLGYHPAFLLSGNGKEYIQVKDKKITLSEIIAGGAKAFPVFDCEDLFLVKTEGYNLHIKTTGFGHFMLWTEVNNMLCIEPITQYPYLEKMNFEENMFKKSKGMNSFSVCILPVKKS
ncbi:aldose 1-epimerase [Namhaeicola litoreus]|uniref:Aldose 1-epimerase n=1 Tax=Namhaeicola litoreus TaxID=1052145 RepID=A0ABW3XYJ8_9FLAO